MPKKSTSKLFQEEETNELQSEDMNLPVDEDGDVDTEATVKEHKAKIEKEIKDAKKAVEQTAEDIVDIDLSHIKKKKFRINGDNSKILELNTSDMGIATRLKNTYPKLTELMDSVADKFDSIPDDEDAEIDESLVNDIGEAVEIIDKKMRELVDYIFDANVSEICGSDGSMWDPIDGVFRYEHIIDKLTKLYENNLDKEYANLKRRVENKAGKYVNLQDHKKKVKR